MKTFTSKKDLYQEVIRLFDERLLNDKKSTTDINKEDYCISRRQYFYLKQISKGEDAPDIAEKKLNCILKMLGIKLEIDCYYKLSEINVAQ